ncbi:MAG: NAD(P)H-hydrate dehydratase, partial [Burkholderiaceae bacterium]
TPHPLEAARLLALTSAEVQSDRLRAAKALVERFDCVVVLKGSGTVIAAPGEAARINSTGNASLASAGTGDVLAGWLGGRWARTGSANNAAATAFSVAQRAVAEHGAAAEPAPADALLASELIDRLSNRR